MKENLEMLISLLTGHMTKAERTWGMLEMSKIYIKPLMYIKIMFCIPRMNFMDFTGFSLVILFT